MCSDIIFEDVHCCISLLVAPGGYGGGKTPLASAVPFLRTAADIAKRFPRAKVHVDAHAGPFDVENTVIRSGLVS